MADWDGLRGGLEDSVTPPPLSALRERRKRRQQRRAIATTFAVVLVGSAGGLAALGRGTTTGAGDQGTPVAAPTALSQIVNSDKLPPPNDYKDYVVTDVDFVTAETGWAIGLRCVGETCDVATWRSDDGGRTWSAPVAVAEDVPRVSFHTQDPAGGAVRSLRMVDQRHGYAFNPDLYVTSDGARTWRRVPQQSKVTSVSVVEESVWVTERGCADGVDCDLVVRAGPLGGRLTGLEIPETNGAAAVVRRAGPMNGYVLAWDAPDAPRASFHRSHDRGLTWTRGTMPCPDATAASLSAGHLRPLWLVCTTPKGRSAYQSDDHGTTWIPLPAPPGEGVVTDLVARSAHDAYLALQEPARLYVTADGGQTWRPAEGAGKGYGYGNLDVVDATHAWAMGDAGLLWRTTDGTSWERLALPPGAPRAAGTPPPPAVSVGLREAGVVWNDVAFASPLLGWAVGQRCAAAHCETVLRRTVDGGLTWLKLPDPGKGWDGEDPHAPGKVTSVTFADARLGWLYGEDVLVTHDGGLTWKDIGSRFTYDVVPRGDAVWAVTHEGCLGTPCSPMVVRGTPAGDRFGEPVLVTGSRARGVFAAGSEEHAYFLHPDDGESLPAVERTADGGETWRVSPAPCRGSLSAYAPTGLWLVCASGSDGAPQTMSVSTDGGRRWRTRPLPTKGPIAGEVVAFSAEHAWRTGANRGLLVTRDGGASWRAAPEVTAKVTALTFTDATHGWLLAGNALWRTTDGATWQRLGRP
ncbi:MAG TPA: hypothetical protein VNQ77_08355 [Frankiaceae bacterium]|nr:hypothetical protein [Frankiaceae bacterium]